VLPVHIPVAINAFISAGRASLIDFATEMVIVFHPKQHIVVMLLI
jgi:hypothetical protein